jgi:putative flippase GtrA
MPAMETTLESGFVVLVPAYRPTEEFLDFVRLLLDQGAPAIVIVDDGSGPSHAEPFADLERTPRVHVLRHAVNLGKGAALKTGINYCLCAWPSLVGVVTADADGQHAAGDTLRVGASLIARPDALILGVRQFDADVPFRSRLGNKVTIALARLLLGQRLSDTQSGLRGIPASLLPHLLRIPASGYEFELEMLIAAKHLSYPLHEERVRTIYLDGNRSSHFNPLVDSMRIYFVLLRFSTLSLFTALVDNGVFFYAFRLTGSIAQAQTIGRTVAVLFNYATARRVVFRSRQSHRVLLPRYLLLVLASGLLSYSLIRLFTSGLFMNVVPAKLLAEGLIFIANFAIQRDFVFTKRDPSSKATNWNEYYTRIPFTARLTRKYTGAVLTGLLRKAMDSERGGHRILVEIGGANSCFFDQIQREVQPNHYYVIDTNQYGLSLL